MKRFNVVLGFLLIVLLPGAAAIAQTVLTDVWKDKEYKGAAKKIAVFVFTEKRDVRVQREDEFMRQLKARGNDTVSGSIIIPSDKMVDSTAALARIKDLGADAILTMRLIDKQEIEKMIPEADKKATTRWSKFYEYVYNTKPRKPDEPVFLETNLFDTATQQRVWTARSVTAVNADATKQQLDRTPGSMTRVDAHVVNPELLAKNIKYIVDQLVSDKMIK